MKVQLETTNLTLIKKKMEAYSLLFDTIPILWLSGYFEDMEGEMVHFRSPSTALKIGHKWIVANVDGEMLHIKPTEAKFSINAIGE